MKSTHPRHALEAACARPWVLTTAQLEERFSRLAVEGAIADGTLTRMARGVYAPSLFAPSLALRARSAIECAGDRAVVSGLAALFLVRAIEAAPPTVLIVLDRHHHVIRQVERAVYYRATICPPTWAIDGLPVAEPEWALVHAMREVVPGRRRDLAITALASDMVDAALVAEIIQRFTHLKGRRQLLEALELHARGMRSALEVRASRDVLVGREFDDIARQFEVVVGARRFYLDAYDEEAMLAIEFDGKRYHFTPERRARDIERDALLASVGIQTLRFSSSDVAHRPAWCRDMVLAAMRRRRQLLGSAA